MSCPSKESPDQPCTFRKYCDAVQADPVAAEQKGFGSPRAGNVLLGGLATARRTLEDADDQASIELRRINMRNSQELALYLGDRHSMLQPGPHDAAVAESSCERGLVTEQLGAVTVSYCGSTSISKAERLLTAEII